MLAVPVSQGFHLQDRCKVIAMYLMEPSSLTGACIGELFRGEIRELDKIALDLSSRFEIYTFPDIARSKIYRNLENNSFPEDPRILLKNGVIMPKTALEKRKEGLYDSKLGSYVPSKDSLSEFYYNVKKIEEILVDPEDIYLRYYDVISIPYFETSAGKMELDLQAYLYKKKLEREKQKE